MYVSWYNELQPQEGYSDKARETHHLLVKTNGDIVALGTYGQYNLFRSVVIVIPKEYVKQHEFQFLGYAFLFCVYGSSKC